MLAVRSRGGCGVLVVGRVGGEPNLAYTSTWSVESKPLKETRNCWACGTSTLKSCASASPAKVPL